jgi:hypothetical protein
LAITANPILDSNPADPGSLFKRSTQRCRITSRDGDVNCRSSPSLSGSVKHKFRANSVQTFTCYKSGDCYENNWYVLTRYLYPCDTLTDVCSAL